MVIEVIDPPVIATKPTALFPKSERYNFVGVVTSSTASPIKTELAPGLLLEELPQPGSWQRATEIASNLRIRNFIRT